MGSWVNVSDIPIVKAVVYRKGDIFRDTFEWEVPYYTPIGYYYADLEIRGFPIEPEDHIDYENLNMTLPWEHMSHLRHFDSILECARFEI